MNRFMLAVTSMALVASLGVAAEIKSGPQVGQRVSAFNPLNVTGSSAGDKACQV